jgi:Fic family protein
LIFDPVTHKGRLELAIKALGNLDSGNNQELNISLTQSTLAAFKIWSDAYDYLRSCTVNDRSLSDDEKVKLEDTRLKERSQGYEQDGEKTIQKLERLLTNREQATQIINFWRKILGVFKR